MVSPYKRRRPSLIRNFWVYRWLIVLATGLGMILWFIFINHTEVTVRFPFGLGTLTSNTGVVILLSAVAGSMVTAATMTLLFAIRQHRPKRSEPEEPPGPDIPDDRPPPDYASKTTEGFSDAPWSSPR